MKSFEELNISPESEEPYWKSALKPHACAGRSNSSMLGEKNDIIALAQTGTGRQPLSDFH